MTTDTELLEKQLLATKRLLAIDEARGSLLRFLQLLKPDQEDPDNPDVSRYEITPQARLLTSIMEKMEQGEMKRVAVSIGPQMGKSEIISRAAPAWFSGRNPLRNMIIASYNQDFANEFGQDVRTIMENPIFKAVFPKHELWKAAVDLLITKEQGKIAFVGKGGSGTGKPADFFIVDDPFKDDQEAQSAIEREKIWKWFNSVVFTRTHSKSGVLVVHTRWHGDDLIGRLCDPSHPERDKSLKGVANRWTYINIPAVVEDKKLAKALGLSLEPPTNPDVVSMFGTNPMSALWPGRKGLEFLAEAKQLDERTFGALYMGKPTPDDGEYFKKEWIVEYDEGELPADLRYYGASDHAVSKKQGRDSTVLGCVGVDAKDDIWVLPDLVIRRMETDTTVEELIQKMQTYSPMLWWMEDELISKSFGPFLRKRMREEHVYTVIDGVRPHQDKQTRARSIQGRLAHKRVHFPRHAPWWRAAKLQLLQFPYAPHDDFVDWLAHIGMGLTKTLAAPNRRVDNDNVIQVGSPKWILQKAALRARKEQREKTVAGW